MGLFGKSDKRQQQQEEPPRQAPSKWDSAATLAEQQNRGFSSKPDWDEDADLGPEDYNSSEWLDSKTRQVQNKSLHTSRRALERLNAAESIGQKNLVTLANQGDQLSAAERRLDDANYHVSMSDTKTDEIKANNRFFMLPTFGARKKAERKQQELTRQHEEAKAANESKMNASRSRSDGLRQMADRDHAGYRNTSSNGGSRFYTTPEGLARDDTEAEIDHNLDQISSGLSRIKMMGRAMNSEIDAQNQQISRISDNTSRTDERVVRSTGKLNKLLNKK